MKNAAMSEVETSNDSHEWRERKRKKINFAQDSPNPIRFLIFFSTFILFLIGENKFSGFLLLIVLPHWQLLPHTSFLFDTPMND